MTAPAEKESGKPGRLEEEKGKLLHVSVAASLSGPHQGALGSRDRTQTRQDTGDDERAHIHAAAAGDADPALVGWALVAEVVWYVWGVHMILIEQITCRIVGEGSREHIARLLGARIFSAMASGKKLINDPNEAVREAIEGLVETYPNLSYLDGLPEIKVVLRADVKRGAYDKVALISGGGSGHEPAHSGFVGQGMLTAAVCGDIFASPSVAAILAAIRAVTGPPGCLLIVKNYTGDRLNFGLAAEQAKAEGYKVEVVIVGDDCALPPPRGIAGRRGLAGTLFVHKVAGAAAQAGLSLSEVAAEARRVSQMVGTMGVGLSVCTIPGQVTSDRLGAGKMELGLGIHGEPGAAVADIQPVDVVVSHLLKKILSQEPQYVPVRRGSRVALMVNGLGATPVMELAIVAGKAVANLQLEHGLGVERVYTGSFMTSLDMAGMSLSVLKVDDQILSRLDASTAAPAWPVGSSGPRPSTTLPVAIPPSLKKPQPVWCGLSVFPLISAFVLVVILEAERGWKEQYKSEILRIPSELTSQGKVLEIAIRAGAEALVERREALNAIDAKVGDGDCGSTMYKGASAILEDLQDHYPLNDAAATVQEIGSSIRRSMGGTSGVIYDIFCRAAYARLNESPPPAIDAKTWAAAFEAANQAVSQYGGATAGLRTLLDALIPASTALREALDGGTEPVRAFLAAAEAAEKGAEATKGMAAMAGRSNYITSDVLSTVPDPGALAAAAWIKAAATAVSEHFQIA
ncbi:hypothetical protein R1sor_014511 [Riccia sorocarpa]|uniref:3,4-dihydroxy-2-butanone kinase n=1 Tax=Riccia sorocarpa TaxID=122646 RepID=A0ABD3H9L1_9MARC